MRIRYPRRLHGQILLEEFDLIHLSERGAHPWRLLLLDTYGAVGSTWSFWLTLDNGNPS